MTAGQQALLERTCRALEKAQPSLTDPRRFVQAADALLRIPS